MTYQFEAEKCIHAASTDNLVLMKIGKGPTPERPSGNSDGTDPGTRAESRCKPRRLPGWGGGGGVGA